MYLGLKFVILLVIFLGFLNLSVHFFHKFWKIITPFSFEYYVSQICSHFPSGTPSRCIFDSLILDCVFLTVSYFHLLSLYASF